MSDISFIDKADWLVNFVKSLGYKFRQSSVSEFSENEAGDTILKEEKDTYRKNNKGLEIIKVFTDKGLISIYLVTFKIIKGKIEYLQIIYDDFQLLFEHFKKEIRKFKLENLLGIK